MWSTRTQSLLAGAALSVAALIAAGPAHAAIYTGNWDPEFGTKFPNLAWTANATFDVPSDCLALGGGTYSGSASACSPVTFSALTVSFYSISGPGGAYNFLESFSLLSGLPSDFVQGLNIVGGTLKGLSSDLSPSFEPTAASWSFAGGSTGGGTANYKFYLGLSIDGEGQSLADLYYVSPTSASNGCLVRPTSTCNIGDNSSVGVLTPAIPEPGTYALMLAGLGVMGFVARRRARH